MRKTILFIGMLLLLCSSSFAKEMTINEAVTYAKENNAGVIALKADKREQERNYKEVQADTRKWQSKRAYSFETSEEYLLFKGYALEQAKIGNDKYTKSVESAEDLTEYNVKNYAYQIELLKRKITLTEEQIVLLESEVKVAELKVKLNMITNEKAEEARISLKTAKADLESTKSSIILAKESLKKEMGFIAEEELNIILPEVEIKKLEIGDIDKYIEENINNNVNVITAKYQFKVLENNYKLAEAGAWFESFDSKVIKDNYKAAEPQLKSQIELFKIYFRQLYKQIKDNEAQIESTEENIKLAENNIKNLEKKYELGTISKIALGNARFELEQAKWNYEALRISSMTLNERFRIYTKSGAMLAEM